MGGGRGRRREGETVDEKREREEGSEQERRVGNWRTHSLRPDDSINEGKDTVNNANCRYLPQRITQPGSRGWKGGGREGGRERGRDGGEGGRGNKGGRKGQRKGRRSGTRKPRERERGKERKKRELVVRERGKERV